MINLLISSSRVTIGNLRQLLINGIYFTNVLINSIRLTTGELRQ